MIQQTSLQSYDSLIWEGSVTRDEIRLMGAFKKLGNWCADFELAEFLGWEQARVSARRNGLIKKGLVKDSGAIKDRWYVNSEGRDVVRCVKVWYMPKRCLL